MKRKLAGAILLSLVTAISASCSRGEVNAAGSALPTGKNQESSAPSGNSQDDEPEITLPEEQELAVDYTTVKGVRAEAGAYLAVVAKGLDSGYWDAVKEGASRAIEDLNEQLGYTGDHEIRMTFEGPGDNSDVDSQINTIDAVLAENPTALCLAAIDMKSCQPQLETAQDNGIPVVMLDSGVESDLAVSSCITDNQSAAAEAAKKLCEAVGDKGQVAVIAHIQSSETSADRVAGFRRELTANHPEIELAEVLYENEEETIENMVRSLLEAHPDLKGIFCTNESMTEKMLDIALDLERDDLKIVGFDAGEKQIKAIADGSEYGTVCQNPYGMGYASVVAALRAAAHQTVDAYIDPGYQWIDKSNMELEENQKYLYK